MDFKWRSVVRPDGRPVSRYDLRRLGTRLAILFRRSVNEGVGPFMLGLMFLCLAAICGRVAYHTYRTYNEAVINEIAWATAPSQPKRDDPYSGVVAAVLAPINGHIVEWRSREEESQAHQSTEALFQSFDWLVARAMELRSKNDHAMRTLPPDVADQQLTADIAQVVSMASLTLDVRTAKDRGYLPEWRRSLSRDLRQICDPASVRLFDLESPATTTRERPFGPMLTQEPRGDDRSTLVVPSLVNMTWSETVVESGSADRQPERHQLRPRCYDAVVFSRLLDRALDLTIPRDVHGSTADDFHLFQAYFISPDSILRIWTSEIRGTGVEKSFPPTRLWASASYFEQILRTEEPEHLTAAYIDYAGGGVVLTRTRPVFDVRETWQDHLAGGEGVSGSAAEPSIDDRSVEGTLLGVIGIDVRVPVDDFVDKLAKSSRLLRVERVEIARREGFAPMKVDVSVADLSQLPRGDRQSVWDGDEELGVSWVQLTGSRRAQIVDAVLKREESPSFFREVSVLTIDGKQSFLVPLDDPGEGAFEAILVTAEPPAAPREVYVATGLSFLSLGAAIGSLLVGGVLARRASALATKVSILRNLQVGVMTMSADDIVIEANDRAEELFGTELPKSGVRTLRSAVTTIRFADLIDDIIVLAPESETGSHRGVMYVMTVVEMRQAGLSSPYFARTKPNREFPEGRWIRIWGSPVLGQGVGQQSPNTFGIVDIVQTEEAIQLLEKAWTAARESQQPNHNRNPGAP